MLRDGNRYERCGAIEAIEEMAFEISLRSDEEPTEERTKLAEFLREEEMVTLICDALDEEITRASAAYVVKCLSLTQAHDKLITLLESDESKTNSGLLRALISVAQPNDESLLKETVSDLLKTALKEGDKEEPTTNYKVVDIFSGFTEAQNQTSNHVFTSFLDDEDKLVRFFACDAIRIAERADLVEEVETLLDDVDPLVQLTALYTATTLKNGGYSERIIEAAKSKGLYNRWIAAECAVFNHEEAVLQAVLPLINDKEAEVRMALVDTCRSMEKSRGTLLLQTLAKDSDPKVRKAAKEAIEKLAAPDSEKGDRESLLAY